MKSKRFILALVVVFAGLQIGFAQSATEPSNAESKISETVSKYLQQIKDKTSISRETREQSYMKLLEGQRYSWRLNRPPRSEAAESNALRLAKQSFQKAVELNPMLAEGYTALAELSNNEEAILLASIAVKIDKNNFGGHYILAQVYTSKSQINRGILDAQQTQKAIEHWKEVTRLDPRNAEGYAFLSEFYARTKKPGEQVAALRNWVAAAAPLNNGSYGNIFRGESLAPENASVKLGEVLAKNGQTREAIEILSLTVADNPGNDKAIKLLSEAIESADSTLVSTAVQSLQQAVYANPENPTLADSLGWVYFKLGKFAEAEKYLKAALQINDSSMKAQEHLGDVYQKQGKLDLAKSAWQKALDSATETNDINRIKAKISNETPK